MRQDFRRDHRLNSMAKIAISLCGEGRGHATRIATLVEHLQTEHEILIFTSADAREFLSRPWPTAACR